MLLPRQTDHHEQIAIACQVEQPYRRNRVCTYGIETRCADGIEVTRDALSSTVLTSIRIRRERTIRHATDVELLLAGEEELAERSWPRQRHTARGDRWRNP